MFRRANQAPTTKGTAPKAKGKVAGRRASQEAPVAPAAAATTVSTPSLIPTPPPVSCVFSLSCLFFAETLA